MIGAMTFVIECTDAKLTAQSESMKSSNLVLTIENVNRPKNDILLDREEVRRLVGFC